MKADEARRVRRARETARENRERGLEEFLRTGERTDRVVPELIPDSTALTYATREVLRLARVANRTPRGKRARKLDELRAAMRRMIYVKKVMALDPVERAALTPARLATFQAGITPEDMEAEWRDMDPRQSNVEVPR